MSYNYEYKRGMERRREDRAYREYDADHRYRGGIGMGGRWAHRSGDPGWSSGGRRVGGWALDVPRQERERPYPGAGRPYETLHARGPLGSDRGFPRGERQYSAYKRSAWHRENAWGRTPSAYDAPYRRGVRYPDYDRDYGSGF